MTDRELLELVAAQVTMLTRDVGDLKKGQESLEKGQESLKKGQENLENEVKQINKIVTNIENDHGNKIQALFDGQKQIFEKLDRIEKEVAKHEEFILKRVK